MIKSSVPSAQTLSCPIEALEKALITFALQGNRAVVQQVLEAWVDSKLLCCAFLSNSILEREIRDFDTLCHKGGMRSEPSIADVFRVVGIAAPIWAKTLETMMVGGKAKMDCEAKDALARLQIICDNPVVKESVSIPAYLFLIKKKILLCKLFFFREWSLFHSDYLWFLDVLLCRCMLSVPPDYVNAS